MHAPCLALVTAATHGLWFVVAAVEKTVSFALVATLTRAERLTVAIATLPSYLAAWTDASASTRYAEIALLPTRAYATGFARHATYCDVCVNHCKLVCFTCPRLPHLLESAGLAHAGPTRVCDACLRGVPVVAHLRVAAVGVRLWEAVLRSSLF